jgi:quercetin dioxygenase-like cupin family protein
MDLVRISELPTGVPDGHWGVAARLVEEAEGRLRVQLCEMAPDGGAEPHAHDGQDQMFVVLEGALEVRGDGGPPLVARAGEAVRIPAGEPHATVNGAGGPACYLVLTYPA